MPGRSAKPTRTTYAYAIAEAVRRPATRCVAIKIGDQLDLQALHRVRSRLISERTAIISDPWLPVGAPHSSPSRTPLPAAPRDSGQTHRRFVTRIIKTIEDLSADWRHLDEHFIEEIEVLADGTESCRQLMTGSGHWCDHRQRNGCGRLAMASLLSKGVILPPGCATIIFTSRSKSIVPVW
jgi:hypothetical protein